MNDGLSTASEDALGAMPPIGQVSAALAARRLGEAVSPFRDARLDLGRCLAALFVIYVHDSVGYVAMYPRLGWMAWHAANLLNSLGRICVPLFIMMSGALLLGRPIPDWAGYIKRRAAGTLKPYLFGSTLYLVWDGVWRGHAPASVLDYLRQFVLGGAYFHLYFLFILLALYIVAPLLQGIGGVSRKTLIGTDIVLFALAIIDRHLQPIGFTLGYLSLGTSLSYLPYFLAGYCLYRFAKPTGWRPAAAFAGATLLTAAVTWAAYRVGGEAAAAPFAQYTSFDVVLQSVAAFWLLLQVRIGARWEPMLRRLADLTLGIYIVHLVVLGELAVWISHVVALPILTQLLLYPVLTFALTALLVRALHAIPGVKGFV